MATNKRDREDGERDERRHAAARQHAVIDFQHEESAGEHQDVAHAGEHGDADQRAPAGGERGRELGRRRALRAGAGGLLRFGGTWESLGIMPA